MAGSIESTTSSSTSLSASNFIVQRAKPSGGGPHARADRCASWAPSSLRYWRPVGGRRSTAVASPPRVNFLRTRATVATRTSNASAIRPSGQPSPSASALSMTRARVMVAAACRPVAASLSSSRRCSAVRRTTNSSFRAMTSLLVVRRDIVTSRQISCNDPLVGLGRRGGSATLVRSVGLGDRRIQGLHGGAAVMAKQVNVGAIRSCFESPSNPRRAGNRKPRLVDAAVCGVLRGCSDSTALLVGPRFVRSGWDGSSR
ncbi:hypothetical protein VT85_17340 [Planctomyces sp. SH-PL62]|nr:hypothetical protein VT85_17340 [Planctomyces sp. SH-PL62]